MSVVSAQASSAGAQTKEKTKIKFSCNKSPKKLLGESGGKAKVKVDFRKEEGEESVSLSLLSTVAKKETYEYWRTVGTRKNRQRKDPRTK